MTKVGRYARCGTPKPFWASSVLRNRSLESRLEIERLTSGLEGGCWKSARSSNSLAAYPTARTVLRGGDDSNVILLPDRRVVEAEANEAENKCEEGATTDGVRARQGDCKATGRT